MIRLWDKSRTISNHYFNIVDMKTDKPYGVPTKKLDVSEMRSIISSKIINNQYYKFKDDDLIQILDDDNSITLNVLVKNRKWDKGGIGLIAKHEYAFTNRIEELLEKNQPLYVCMNYNRIDDTVDFINSWIKEDYMKLYSLYPNKIQTINYLRGFKPK